jgi:hypothetical protein
MATAFDGIGMSQLGSERRFMTGDNPISQGLKGLKDFAILSAMDKSGLVGFLNNLGQSKKDMMGKYPGLAPAGAAVPTNQPMPVNPQAMPQQPPVNPSVSNPSGGLFNNEMQQKSIEDAADEAMGLSKSSSFISPDTLKTSNEPDQVQQQVASGFPPPMQMPKYGGNGQGINLLKLFLGK